MLINNSSYVHIFVSFKSFPPLTVSLEHSACQQLIFKWLSHLQRHLTQQETTQKSMLRRCPWVHLRGRIPYTLGNIKWPYCHKPLPSALMFQQDLIFPMPWIYQKGTGPLLLYIYICLQLWDGMPGKAQNSFSFLCFPGAELPPAFATYCVCRLRFPFSWIPNLAESAWFLHVTMALLKNVPPLTPIVFPAGGKDIQGPTMGSCL